MAALSLACPEPCRMGRRVSHFFCHPEHSRRTYSRRKILAVFGHPEGIRRTSISSFGRPEHRRRVSHFFGHPEQAEALSLVEWVEGPIEDQYFFGHPERSRGTSSSFGRWVLRRHDQISLSEASDAIVESMHFGPDCRYFPQIRSDSVSALTIRLGAYASAATDLRASDYYYRLIRCIY